MLRSLRRLQLRQWALAACINFGAVVVAVVAFGVWRHFQPASAPLPPTRIEGTIQQGFYEPADDVGYIPIANKQVTAREMAGDRQLFNVTYTIGPDQFRIMPEALPNAESCLLVFGDSFTFGVGVNDSETYAAQVVLKSAGKIAAQNLAHEGWGPHQFLAGLQSGRFQRAVRCRPTDATYLMIPPHIYRVEGATSWDKHGPRYRLGADGRPVRDGNFDAPSRFNWRPLLGLNPMGDDEAAELTAAVILEAVRELKNQFAGIRFHFIAWNNGGAPIETTQYIENCLVAAGIIPHPIEAILPRFPYVRDDYVTDPLVDTHPNVRAHVRIADYLIREVMPPALQEVPNTVNRWPERR